MRSNGQGVRAAALVAAAIIACVVASGLLAGCRPAKRTDAGVRGSSETTAWEVPLTSVVDFSAFPVTVTDDAFRRLTFKEPPSRVVSLAPGNTEILYSLGLFGDVVGVTTYDDYPDAVADVPKMGDFTTPNLEAIASAQPDLILVTGGVQADIIKKLEGTGAQVMVVDPKDIKGVFHGIDIVSQVMGVPSVGSQLVESMRSDLIRLRAAVSAEPTVSAFVEIGWDPLYTAGRGTLLDDLIRQAGGSNVVSEPGYVSYSIEQLVKDQPEVYLGTLGSIGDPITMAQRPGYSAIAAVKKGRVFTLTDNLVSRPGPRIVQGVREIAKALHPDLFE